MNTVTLIGRLGADPEMRQSKGGLDICKFSMATDKYGKSGGADWHSVVVFGKQAEACGRFLAKGRQVAVQGRIEYSKYEKDGETKYFTQIVANSVEFLGSREDSPSSGDGYGSPAKPLDHERELTSSLDDSDIPF